MPTIYHHPLTSSIEVDTEFDSTKIPVKYTTSTQESVYTIVSDAIFIGDSNTQSITFTANNFTNINFREEGCDSEGRTLNLEEIYNLKSAFDIDEDKITFKVDVYFDNKVTFNGDSIFNGKAQFKNPHYIIFEETGENLEEYISNHDWTFTNTITFSGADKINVNDDTTLEDYVENKIIEKGRIQIKVVDELPQPGESGVLYLIADIDETGESFYKEYLWITKDSKYELIGTTKINYSDLIQKNKNNELPQFEKEKWIKFNGKPGIMFDNKFYLFDSLLSEDGETTVGDEKYVKLKDNNVLEGEIGLTFNGQFFSFESLYNTEWTGPNFITNKSDIIVEDENRILVCTIENEESLKIMTDSEDYIILDAQCIDQNSTQWVEIDYLEREGRCGAYLSFTPSMQPAYAWFIVKTMNITDAADSGGSVKDVAIFLRNNKEIKPKSGVSSNSFKYKTSPTGIYTYLPENNLIITVSTGIVNLFITHSSFTILDAHLISSTGLSKISGFSNNEIAMTIDQSHDGYDWLALKVLNKDSGNVFYRSIKITK